MARSAVDAQRLDREAHELFTQLGVLQTTGQDKDGRTITITPGERFAEINRRARLIAVSDTLARAVVALLAARGVPADVDHVRVDPAAEGDEQVMGVRVQVGGADAVVPLRPAATSLRAYPAVDDIDLTGHTPLAEVALPPAADGWVTAEAVTTALLHHLTPATT
ncbi:hypothetical protein [Saccharothrix longispora]|uniref:hypothetical protein n=1 Tax=Saccharothrix longispora TaxID=33920 RepID=UPI0028FD6F86|nr:hypothetical protein [Saccharothrix longispora]MDU0291801.1 hypothetical protein [Saccharothrix longispora]